MSDMSKIAHKAIFQPKEALASVGKSRHALKIGVPKEVSFQENRIALTPISVALLVEYGHEIVIEAGAEEASNFLDTHYAEQGARISHDKQEVFECDLVVKIASPTIEEV